MFSSRTQMGRQSKKMRLFMKISHFGLLNRNWKDWYWSFNTLATWWEEPTNWKRPWCWERLKAGGEGVSRGRDGWMAPTTQWTWVWASSGRRWRTRKPGVLQSMGLQKVGHDWVTEQQQPLCAPVPSIKHKPATLTSSHSCEDIWQTCTTRNLKVSAFSQQGDHQQNEKRQLWNGRKYKWYDW